MKPLLCIIAIFTAPLSLQAKEIDYELVRSLVETTEEESIWKDKFEWHTDLWKARQLANKVGKPLLIWEMDGHPMGCT